MAANPVAVPRRVIGIPEEIAKVRVYFIRSEVKQASLLNKNNVFTYFQVIAFLADRESSGIIIGQNIIADGGSILVMGSAAILK